MKKRVFCILMSLMVIAGGIISLNVEYKAYIENEQNQVQTISEGVHDMSIDQVEKVEWEYPITPDDPEWSLLGSVKAKIEACRIPTEVLKKMTDEQLVQAILDFPFLIDLFLTDSKEAAVESLERTCDAYKELLTRSSAKSAMLNAVDERISLRDMSVTAEQEILNDALAILVFYQEDFKEELASKDISKLAQLSSQIENARVLENILQTSEVPEP